MRVIAGEYAGAKGPAHTFTPITLLDVSLHAGAHLPIALPASYNVLAVVAEGRVRTGSTVATAGELILFNNDGTQIGLAADEAHTSSCFRAPRLTSLSSSTGLS